MSSVTAGDHLLAECINLNVLSFPMMSFLQKQRREVGVAIKGLYRKDPCGVGTILYLDRMTISLMVMIL